MYNVKNAWTQRKNVWTWGKYSRLVSRFACSAIVVTTILRNQMLSLRALALILKMADNLSNVYIRLSQASVTVRFTFQYKLQ